MPLFDELPGLLVTLQLILGRGQFGWAQALLGQFVWVTGGYPFSVGAFHMLKAVSSGNARTWQACS